ncbi:hypothetical protein AAVH_27709 [Aphelenchoides avenae]|nr:hypothetical protein AAVH_27709 [Aphelenchus avenae]
MRFNDNFRRRVIIEIRDRARVIWDPAQPGFHAIGARQYAFHGVAYRLSSADIQLDIRRMWNRYVRSFLDYKLKRLSRKPKFYRELSFLNELGMGMLHTVASKY